MSRIIEEHMQNFGDVVILLVHGSMTVERRCSKYVLCKHFDFFRGLFRSYTKETTRDEHRETPAIKLQMPDLDSVYLMSAGLSIAHGCRVLGSVYFLLSLLDVVTVYFAPGIARKIIKRLESSMREASDADVALLSNYNNAEIPEIAGVIRVMLKKYGR